MYIIHAKMMRHSFAVLNLTSVSFDPPQCPLRQSSALSTTKFSNIFDTDNETCHKFCNEEYMTLSFGFLSHDSDINHFTLLWKLHEITTLISICGLLGEKVFLLICCNVTSSRIREMVRNSVTEHVSAGVPLNSVKSTSKYSIYLGKTTSWPSVIGNMCQPDKWLTQSSFNYLKKRQKCLSESIWRVVFQVWFSL